MCGWICGCGWSARTSTCALRAVCAVAAEAPKENRSAAQMTFAIARTPVRWRALSIGFTRIHHSLLIDTCGISRERAPGEPILLVISAHRAPCECQDT